VTVCGAAILGSAGTASAGNNTFCKGTVKPANKKKPGVDAVYNFSCSDDIRGYSIVTTRTLDFFGTETNTSPDTSQSAIMQCEGTVPGHGFGCGVVNQYSSPACGGSGKPSCSTAPPCGQPTTAPCTSRLSAGNFISGDISFDKSPCDRSGGKLRIWVTATSDPFITAISPTGGASTTTVGEYGSQPWPLKVKGYGKCGGGKKKH